VTLNQRFENRHAAPLRVTYSLPLPADAAVSGFAFVIGDRRVVGEVARREDARERFEQALAEARSAGPLGSGAVESLHPGARQHPAGGR
jgi:Ca-activated chloride channel family protein